jgi:predicted kinase
MEEKQLIVLVGLPNSGKTTYRNRLTKKHPNKYKVISFDDMLENCIVGNSYNEKFDNYKKYKISFNLNSILNEYVDNGDNIIIDMTNLEWNKESKYSVQNLIEPTIKANYNINIIVFDTDFNLILERNQKRDGKFIPIFVLNKMRVKFTEIKKNDYKKLMKVGGVFVINN